MADYLQLHSTVTQSTIFYLNSSPLYIFRKRTFGYYGFCKFCMDATNLEHILNLITLALSMVYMTSNAYKLFLNESMNGILLFWVNDLNTTR